MNEGRLEYLAALRGWAAFAVVVTHVGSQMGGNINLLTDSGARGVQLFFMLSAFTLFHTHNKEHSREPNETFNFFVRRFFRIAPMFYATILLVALTNVVPAAVPLNTAHAAALLTFTHGFFPSFIGSFMNVEWSLSHEILFYAVTPILFLLIKNARSAIVWIVFSLLAGGFLTKLLVSHPDIYASNGSFPFFWFPNQMSAFFFGILLYYVSRQKLGHEWGWPLLLVAAWLAWALYKGGDIYTFPRHQLWNLAFLSLALALQARPFHVLVNRATIHFGKISYSVYLLHLPVLFYIERFTMRPDMNRPLVSILNLTLTTAIVWVLATLAYRYIERPGIRIGKYIIKTRSTKARHPGSLDAQPSTTEPQV